MNEMVTAGFAAFPWTVMPLAAGMSKGTTVPTTGDAANAPMMVPVWPLALSQIAIGLVPVVVTRTLHRRPAVAFTTVSVATPAAIATVVTPPTVVTTAP